MDNKGHDFFTGTQNQLKAMTDDELKSEYVACLDHSIEESEGFWHFRQSCAMLEALERNLDWTSWGPSIFQKKEVVK